MAVVLRGGRSSLSGACGTMRGMADEFTIDAKYKRDNLIDEHERYRKALETIAALDEAAGHTQLHTATGEANAVMIARTALRDDYYAAGVAALAHAEPMDDEVVPPYRSPFE